MQRFLLFIDTETTNVPKRWDVPYSDTKNWPSAVQISWMIYSLNGNLLKKENHFLYDDKMEIAGKSVKIHGLKKNFLKEIGENVTIVLDLLSQDLKTYDPLIIGHFIEFDIHVLSCDYLRAGLQNPFLGRSFFCTMLKSKVYNKNPKVDYLRLPQLYEYLFDKPLLEFHKADKDADSTAKCFFELRSRNEISDNDLSEQQKFIISKLHFNILKV